MTDKDVIIIGAGQAGVVLSGLLKKRQIAHVVIERDRAFSNFHKTWDAFLMNTQNFANALPDAPEPFAPEQGRTEIATRAHALSYLAKYLAHVDPPLQTGVTVTDVYREGDRWKVACEDGRTWRARAVVCCTGIAGRPVKPIGLASALPDRVPQIHSHNYRRPADVETQRVLVVGSGASGTQIARDLATSGKEVILACSDVGIVPLKLLGFVPTMKLMGFVMSRVTRESWLGQRMYEAMQGKGQPTVPPGPMDLARDHGVRCVGRLQGCNPDESLRFEDGSTTSSEDLTVLWCTGFSYDFSYLDIGMDDPYAEPDHRRGVSTAQPGLYYLGLKFLWKPTSHLIGGVGEDAAYVADRIAEQLG